MKYKYLLLNVAINSTEKINDMGFGISKHVSISHAYIIIDTSPKIILLWACKLNCKVLIPNI